MTAAPGQYVRGEINGEMLITITARSKYITVVESGLVDKGEESDLSLKKFLRGPLQKFAF